MDCVRARPGPGFRTVIPKLVRDALGLRPGDSVFYIIQGDSATMRRCPPGFAEAMRGLHKELWGDPDQWLEQERAAWE
jgi:bifunctional DNA-binding transcriptional regulator/antitoxin component of YhaV-PrlF toxin-antitoxin module